MKFRFLSMLMHSKKKSSENTTAEKGKAERKIARGMVKTKMKGIF
jgi:hypothetical protein